MIFKMHFNVVLKRMFGVCVDVFNLKEILLPVADCFTIQLLIFTLLCYSESVICFI